MPKIAYLTTCSPLGPTCGHALRVNANWCAMRAIGETRVWAFASRPSPAERLTAREQGVIALPARHEPRRALLMRHLRACAAGRSMLYAKAMSPRRIGRIRRELEAWRTDLLVIGDTWLADLLEPLRGAARRIAIDTHNVESRLYRQLLAEQRGVGGRIKYRLFLHNVRRLEARLAAADAVFAVSEADAAAYRAEQRLAHVHVLPNGLDTDRYRPGGEPVEPDSLVFTGSYGYWPNAAAALHLIAMSKALSGRGVAHRMLLVGRDPTPAMIEAASGAPQVTIVGPVPEIRPYIARAALIVAPLTSGSGTKYKILEAMAMARPVVTTPVGAEGLDLVDGRHAAIAPDLDRFAERVTLLLAEPEQATAMGVAAREHVLATHSLAALERCLRRAMASMQELAP
ncbi:MAG: glycosyltransferase [Geminicoccaceae bacterium]